MRLFIFSLFALFAAALKANLAQKQRTFSIDQQNNEFLMDGQPFRYIAGEINYFRIHRADWEDRIQRARALGLNALSVYIPWHIHQPTPSEQFNFSGNNNLTEFLLLAQQHELFVLLRIGPYVCAELDFGGLPWWLNRDSQMRLRTSDPSFLDPVKRYFDILLPIVKPLLYKNGGPVIMVQIENEYGSHQWTQQNDTCKGFDRKYIEWLRDEVRTQLGQDVVLYSTDDSNVLWRMKCVHVDGVYSTPDFGVQPTEFEVFERFQRQRKISKGGPPVNSEFYTSWFTWWSNPVEVRQNIEGTLSTMDWMWGANASFSFYMVHGGSNFQFLAGNKINEIPAQNWSSKEGPITQSYDYAAPISESGQITPLYEAIRKWIEARPEWKNKPRELPGERRAVPIDGVEGTRLDMLALVKEMTEQQSGKDESCLTAERPVNIEQLDKDYPLTLYSTVLNSSGINLEIARFSDHAYVFLDGVFKGNLTNPGSGYFSKKMALKGVNASGGQQLDIIVEHMGRLIFPLAQLDPKGILSEVLLDGQPIGEKWRICGIDVNKLYKSAKKKLEKEQQQKSIVENSRPSAGPTGPALFAAKFSVPQHQQKEDWTNLHTFFDSRGWGHGILVLNEFVVGRYWPIAGPQMTLFVPGAVVEQQQQKGTEHFVLLIELHGREKGDSRISFIPKPVWEYPADNEAGKLPP